MVFKLVKVDAGLSQRNWNVVPQLQDCKSEINTSGQNNLKHFEIQPNHHNSMCCVTMW